MIKERLAFTRLALKIFHISMIGDERREAKLLGLVIVRVMGLCPS